jgi:hypothetical protein
MPMPNGGLITESNRQYYAGAQGFFVEDIAGQSVFTFTFDTEMILGSWDQDEAGYALNNFKLYTSPDGVEYTEYLLEYSLEKNIITLADALDQGYYIVAQLKALEGGNYGDYDAYGDTVETHYGSYAYVSLNDIVNNFYGLLMWA